MSTDSPLISPAPVSHPSKARDVLPEYKRTDIGDIPQNWDAKPLRADVVLLSGRHVLARHCNTRHIGTPYLTGPADFPYGNIQHTKFTDRPTTLCRIGDILVTVKGSGSGTLIMADGEYCISRQLMAIRPIDWNPQFLFFSLLQNASRFKAAATGLIPGLSRLDILDQQLPVPTDPSEQRAIAEALSDVDGLLEALWAMIAKKRAIKQAAMQQLLTGKTRLPGFSGQWERKPFSAVLDRLNAKRYQIQTSEYRPSGLYPVIDQGQDLVVAFSDEVTKRFKCPDAGVIVFGDHTCITKFISFDFVVGADGTQLIKAKLGQSTRFYAYQLQHKGIEPTGYNRHFRLLREREFVVPTGDEQVAIATVLSDMDAEITALEARRDKTRDIKQGMMQQLLTGRVRLVKPASAEASA